MSKFDYDAARSIRRSDPPFAALIMAAMMRADTWNAELLKASFPLIWIEVEQRYNAPGGMLPGDSL